MTRLRTLIFLILNFSLILSVQAQAEVPYRVVGYYTSYSIYSPDYFVTDIPAENLTHLIYSAIDISDNGQCVSSDEWADMRYPYPGDGQNERLRGNFKQLNELRRNHPDLQILMSVGSWNFSANFSNAVLDQQARIRLARSCVAFMREYGFDGIDVDWRFPVVGGIAGEGRTEDKDNLTFILAEFRGQFDYWAERDGRDYLMTITTPSSREIYENYDFTQFIGDIDWINLMAYSYQGDWSNLASHHAPLYPSVRDPRGVEFSEEFSISGTVNDLLDAGVPANKIVLGVPFFAHSWSLARTNDFFGLYGDVTGVPNGTRPGGTLYYSDLVSFLNNTSYVRYFDQDAIGAWMFNENARIAISYDNVESIQNKARFVRANGLGGMMAWELSFDSANRVLLSAIYNGLYGE